VVKVLSPARRLILRLAETALHQYLYYSHGSCYTDTPGRFIKRLSSEQRETLKQLKSGDLEDVRIT